MLLIDVKFDEKFESELTIKLTCKDKPGNQKNLPNNEGKFWKIEQKRLSQFSNSPIPFRKVFPSKVFVISHLSAKF